MQNGSSILKHESGQPILACDGQGLKRLIWAALAWLERHADVVNSLNVFPVPDGDTGTNMLLTLQAAWEEIAESPEDNVGAIARAVAHGALMGARGNSGVILSQILRGMAKSLDNKPTFNSADFAAALQEAVVTAYKGVIKPVEGTILTVVRETAEAVSTAVQESDDLRHVLEVAVKAARESVARTPSLLPVLREAGVVDAGGQGLFIILEGMHRYIRGESVSEDKALAAAVDLRPVGEGEEYGYDVQFIIQGENLDVDEIRRQISAMGESVLVVGDHNTVKVHIHTPEPGTPLNYGASLGSLSKIIVENLQEQYQEFILSRSAPPVSTAEVCDIACVVVAPGSGLKRVFESLGAGAVVSGGQTMNPSTEELLRAVDSLPTDNVIILPNNSNIILAAQQAQSLSSKNVRIVPTKTIPQGISALLALNYQADLDTNVRLMTQAAENVRTAEVTVATRDARINGLEVKSGQVIGLLDDKLTAVGSSDEEVALQLLEQVDLDEAEIITIYYGEHVSQEQAQALADQITARYPDLETELVDGGQPYYHYIISIE